MPALAELDSKLVNASQDVAAPAVAEPEVAEAATEISTAGTVPDVAANGAAVETGATASEQAFGDQWRMCKKSIPMWRSVSKNASSAPTIR